MPERGKGAAKRTAPSRTGPKGAGAAPPSGDPVRETVAAIRADHPSCNVAFCPICLVVTAIGDVRPELMEHLLMAGRELLLAARAVIDARLETLEEDEEGSSGLQRINIE